MNIEANIHNAVARALGQRAVFVDYTPVVESVDGKVIWQGIVSTFNAADGRTCYGWAIPGLEEPEYVTVLGSPSVRSPVHAVREWLASRPQR